MVLLNTCNCNTPVIKTGVPFFEHGIKFNGKLLPSIFISILEQLLECLCLLLIAQSVIYLISHAILAFVGPLTYDLRSINKVYIILDYRVNIHTANKVNGANLLGSA